MPLLLEILVWTSLGFIGLSYVGYPLILIALDAAIDLRANLGRLKRPIDRRQARERPLLPSVSLVVAAHNEEAVLRQKLENCLTLDYPPDRLEVLIGSDGSTDATEEIARAYAFRGVRLSSGPRCGKAGVLNRLVPEARGDIVVLSDANTLLEPTAVRRLVCRFEDPRVGAVCGRLRLRSSDGSAQESAYWNYESLIKLYEGRRGAVLGANGGLYAIRRRLFTPLPSETITDDFVLPVRLLAAGHRVVYEPAAVAIEDAGSTATEVRRRQRIAGGNLQSLRLVRALWDGPRPLIAAAFVLHKVLRWLGPAFLAVALAGAALLAGHPVFRALFVAQLGFYTAALWGGGTGSGPVARLCRLSHHFVAMNLALAAGAWQSFRGLQGPTWQRTERRAA